MLAWSLAACSPTPALPSASELSRPTETQPARDLGKEALINAVDTLPNSPLQGMVSDSLHRYYGNPQPKTVSYGDLSFQIAAATVTITRTSTPKTDGVEGVFNYRQNTPPDALSAIKQQQILLPFDDLLLEGELDQLPPHLHSPNNTFLFPFDIPIEGKFSEVIKPAIAVTSYESPRHFFTPKEKQDLERFTLVKEAASLALQDLFVQRLVAKMHAMNLPTRIDALTPKGEKVNASPLADAMAILSTNRGRFTASLDLGGYFLMFKLFEGTDMEQTLGKLPGYTEAINSAKRFPLPADLSELFTTAVRWANSGPEPLKLGHVGEMTKIP